MGGNKLNQLLLWFQSKKFCFLFIIQQGGGEETFKWLARLQQIDIMTTHFKLDVFQSTRKRWQYRTNKPTKLLKIKKRRKLWRVLENGVPHFFNGNNFLRVVFSYCLTLRVAVITNELLLLFFFLLLYYCVCTREEEVEKVGRNTKTDVDYFKNESINNITQNNKCFQISFYIYSFQNYHTCTWWLLTSH